MNKRLQVVINNKEYQAIQRQSAREGKTLSEWVRGLIRQQIDRKPSGAALSAEQLFRHMDFPAPPIDEMLDEIERGRV